MQHAVQQHVAEAGRRGAARDAVAEAALVGDPEAFDGVAQPIGARWQEAGEGAAVGAAQVA